MSGFRVYSGEGLRDLGLFSERAVLQSEPQSPVPMSDGSGSRVQGCVGCSVIKLTNLLVQNPTFQLLGSYEVVLF